MAETTAGDDGGSVSMPIETTDTSTTSQSTLRTPPPCVNVRTVGSPARQVGDIISGNTDPAPTEGGIPVFTSGTNDVSPNVEPSGLFRMKDKIKESRQQALDIRRTSLNPYKTTRADNAHPLPRKKRSEIEKEIAQREYEAAKAAEKLARAKLLALQEQEETEEEIYEHVEEWVIQNSEEIQDKSYHQVSRQDEISTVQLLVQEIKKLNAKDKDSIELPSFSGASSEWINFKKAYFESTENFSHAMNRARLRKALRGTAKETVESLMNSVDDPMIVIRHLEDRFGRPGSLALAELEKMKRIKPVKNDPRDICRFASQVKASISVIKTLKKPQYLHSPETSNCIKEKMSVNMFDRYVAFYSRYRDTEIADLEIMDLFLTEEIQNYGVFAPPEISDTIKPQYVSTRRTVHAMLEPEDGKEESPSTSREIAIRTTRSACTLCYENHGLLECKKFREASVDERWEIAKKAKICFKCLRNRHQRLDCKAPPCRRCRRYHHVTLHSERPAPAIQQKRESCNNVDFEDDRYNDEDEYFYEEPEEKIASINAAMSNGKVYLKMIPVNLYGPKGQVQVLALLDEGSTITLVDSSIAEKIGVEGKREPLTIETVGGKELKKNNSSRVKLKIKGVNSGEIMTMEARTIDDLKLSEQEVDAEVISNCPHLVKIRKELIYAGEKPKLLIGQDNWGLIITRKLLKGKATKPVASLTRLGWVLHGFDTSANAVVNFINHCRTREDEVEEIVREHFKLESLGIQPNLPSNDSDRRALEILEKTTKKLPNNQYETGLLWKKEDETLPNNYNQALRRLMNIEKKLDRDDTLKICYTTQIDTLLKRGYAEKAPENINSGRTFYLPHFAVVHPTKKKPRIVFDAAAKFEGKSLNDALLTGPDLLQSLFGVLLRFREGPVAVVADVQEMFLRIKIREADRDSLRFLWRGEDRNKKPEEYRMTSVIFGAASSPATAIYVMNKNAKEYGESYPEAVKAIERNHYMDDYLQSFSTLEEAKQTAAKVKAIHDKASFHLKGWASNDARVIEEFTGKINNDCLEIMKEEKTLGLRWLIKEDALAFNVGLRNTSEELMNGKKIPTKREVMSAVMSTFDPLGFATPVLIMGKKLIQDIWRTNIGWNEKIQDEQVKLWFKYLEEVSTLKELKIARCISPNTQEGELHTFTDASEEAYAAAVYWRTIGSDEKIHVTLIAGKARVAPTKPISIPRLELQAALLGTRLAATIEREMDLRVLRKAYWTDSSTVLQWIKSDPRKFKTFVAHRLAEIEETTKIGQWRWVPTKENPADDATRGTPNDFDQAARWFQGPSFLRKNEEEWPVRRFENTNESQEEKEIRQQVATLKVPTIELPDPERFSSWTKLLRTTARVIQFLNLLRKRKNKIINAARRKEEIWRPNPKPQKKKERIIFETKKKEKIYFIPLEEEHLRKAEEFLIRRSQMESFDKEMAYLKKEIPLENSSRLKKINVYLNSNGIIKLRSRTRKFSYRKTNPPVLDGKHKIVRLIIEDYHKRFLHANTLTVMNEIRQKYWILGLRSTVKGITHGCQWCKVKKSMPEIPPIGDLPIERMQCHQYPFSSSGVDYFGPMTIKVGRRIEKRWGALFTCLTTRAIHLELVPSLTASSMIMALRRMAARRGMPKTIISDNATNFIKASKELEEAAAERGIRWKFIPPGTPNMAGAWERMVRSVKTALAAVLNERNPPEEVLHTLITEVEHIVNSRPLTHLSTDPDDEESLTPNHFLLGRSCGTKSPGEFNDQELVGKANWRTAQRLTDHFWKRWIDEYLPTLMPRKITGRETNDPQVGDIVLIVDSTLPRNTWPRGKVTKLYPGPDGRTRIVDVKTTGGILRRPSRRVIVVVPTASSL
nr:uncharacterized protein LOC117983216 [Maniola hyperantus]